jgi:alkanesulfonate monooxygenase SsuD/methylene tetrahydromethanopterin reductase-like flavin-dependent oxidoreductase (luciferase family)
MRFCYFTPVPWPNLSARPEHWPFPNREFDAHRCATLFRDSLDLLIEAEACGFDWVGVGEDHMTAYGLTPNPLLFLSAVAAQTSRVGLAILGAPLPLLNPIRVAEECAMLDVMSKGRLIAGFIRGVPQNYAAYNIDPNESRARFAEANDLIHKAWTSTETFAWEGEHYAFPTVSIWPRPLQQPHPPVLYSANSTTSATFGATKRAMIGAIHLYNRDAIDRVGEAIEAYRVQAASDGWTPDPDRFVLGLQTCIANTDEEAFATLEPAIDYQYTVLSGTYNAEKRRIAAQKPGYGLSPTEERPPTLAERIERGIALCGSPDTVNTQIAALEQRLGVGTICMHMQVGNIATDSIRRSMVLFKDHVRPAHASSLAPMGGTA